MADPDHLEKLSDGIETWNEWRRDNPDIIPDLRESDLYKFNLCKIDLCKSDLSRADLSEVDLSEANLNRANLNVRISLGRNFIARILSGRIFEKPNSTMQI